MEYIEHRVVPGERWDQIAYKYYGNALLYEAIIRANPYVPIAPFLPQGLLLRVPILEADDIEEDKGDLPPWRQ